MTLYRTTSQALCVSQATNCNRVCLLVGIRRKCGVPSKILNISASSAEKFLYCIQVEDIHSLGSVRSAVSIIIALVTIQLLGGGGGVILVCVVC